MALTKRQLEIILENLSPHPKPRVLYEQYTIPGYLAAHMLHTADVNFGDIQGKVVADLGAGAGRLAIGAKLLGAKQSIGVDIDGMAISIANRNSQLAEVSCDWVVGDFHGIRGGVDTVVMNPPFGTKIKHADIRFLDHATTIAKTTYSLHKSSTRRFIMRRMKEKGHRAEALYEARFEIPRLFRFHRKRKISVEVDLIRVQS